MGRAGSLLRDLLPACTNSYAEKSELVSRGEEICKKGCKELPKQVVSASGGSFAATLALRGLPLVPALRLLLWRSCSCPTKEAALRSTELPCSLWSSAACCQACEAPEKRGSSGHGGYTRGLQSNECIRGPLRGWGKSGGERGGRAGPAAAGGQSQPRPREPCLLCGPLLPVERPRRPGHTRQTFAESPRRPQRTPRRVFQGGTCAQRRPRQSRLRRVVRETIVLPQPCSIRDKVKGG